MQVCQLVEIAMNPGGMHHKLGGFLFILQGRCRFQVHLEMYRIILICPVQPQQSIQTAPLHPAEPGPGLQRGRSFRQ